MKSVLFILLISLSFQVKALSYNYKNTFFNASASGYYTFINGNDVVPSDMWQVFLDLSVANKYFGLSTQISSNEYNILRRLQLDIPLYNYGIDFQSMLSIGRLNMSSGLLNTTTRSPAINGMTLLPLATYDIRRYDTNPDTMDAIKINLNSIILKSYKLDFNFLIGYMMIDQPYIPIFTSFPIAAKMYIDPKISESFNISLASLDFKVKYSFTNENVHATNFEPPVFSRFVQTRDINQKTHHFGVQYLYEDWTFQSEMSYRQINITSNIFGIYGMISKNFNSLNLRSYVGYSYGTRKNVDSHLHDAFVGLEYTFNPFKFSLEYHKTIMDNWKYDAPDPLDSQTNIILSTISVSF